MLDFHLQVKINSNLAARVMMDKPKKNCHSQSDAYGRMHEFIMN